MAFLVLNHTMSQLNVAGKLTYTANGVHRIYSLAGQPAGQPLTKFLIKVKKDKVVSNISKTKALEVIKTINSSELRL